MKKLLVLGILMVVSFSCSKFNNGELTGVQGRKGWFEPQPYGMAFVPMGSFNMGPSDQDVTWAMTSYSKTVSVDAFWMDETEITNNEYRQFVYYVRDSIMRRKLGETIEDFLIAEDQFGNPIDPPVINWETEIDPQDEEQIEILNELYLAEHERFYRRKEIDTRKLMFEYYRVDMQQAAKKSNRYNFDTKEYSGTAVNAQGEIIEVEDRSAFVLRDVINVYPDTLSWISDFTYSFNEPYTNMYFWHPSYDNYPVIGVTWKQARAFTVWRTQYLNSFLMSSGEGLVQDFRLPSEAEWEYASRGNLDLSMYPWGGMYTRNKQGCFLANFKPLRGNYIDDGGLITVAVGSYSPNEYGLFDMSGNVSEWTANAFDESAYTFMHDMNPDYRYEALPNDPASMKRKVVRGGSWKDIGYFLQNGTRAYEYQDSAKSYIGFRCVRSYLGSNN
ncbi:MAG: gliding motility-associated lipoprotein [Bacteroidetes bacterium GWC2_33_15]|nr:MAG: gliding motility-associated lipoprotein [Bacteroidetes bacterium GWA2_33_15]OFX51954.1 MAG: gliding motility-associated lipoprotein [Bacteroidetes bacterium GWC2_33_15]OFX63784.1 MAG: gliding motility-associated lipoprotein [Bacteroidetes bacterium GWB2_32_14]OFX67357.1 MAG: gliding motility-associated lipoprotein [Bacteroidetes bacterium GWD2_33_33]HAN17882.1 gliding motility-associated lipoprotein [Bacteroidales bacterium]